MDRPAQRASGRQADLRAAPFDGAVRVSELEAENALLKLELAQAEHSGQQQDLIAKELIHRISNLLAVVQAVARNTFREADPALMADFSGRLGSLATAQKLLHGDASSKGLFRIISEALAPHGFDDKCTISGPDIRLSGRRAHALTLAVHELATNAAKYGALSVDGGRIDVSWTDTADELNLVWREHGGPPVVAPTRKGFGTLLVTRNLEVAFSGKAEIAFDPEGVVFRLRAFLAPDQVARGRPTPVSNEDTR